MIEVRSSVGFRRSVSRRDGVASKGKCEAGCLGFASPVDSGAAGFPGRFDLLWCPYVGFGNVYSLSCAQNLALMSLS
jgi:hypothetical protein